MKKKLLNFIICILLCMMSYASVTANQSNDQQTTQPDPSYQLSHVVLTTNNAPYIASVLKTDGFDVLAKTITNHSFELIVSPSELQILQAQGFAIEVLSQGRPFRDIQKEQQQGTPSYIPPGYLDYPDIIDALYDAQDNYPSICKVYNLTTWYNLSTTHEGRDIFALKISDNVEDDEDEPNFLMVSAHHAREIVTPVIALYAIDQLTSNYGINASVTAAVDNYEIWISPVWNPDGYVHMFNYDNYWRKNRCPYPPGIGVDLNRNYPFGWHSPGSGSTNPTSETYKGPSPASEAETKTMMVFGNDRHFAKVIDYHSYGREVLFGYNSLSHPFTGFLQSEAVRLSIAIGYGGTIRVPSADGENYQWHLAYNGSYANLVETHTTFQPTYASAFAEASLVWPGTLWLVQRPISLSGHVTDAFDGTPLVASIKLQGITFPNGEHFMSEPRYGRYHLFLPPGTYTVNFSAEGYHSQHHEITVGLSSAQILEIPLNPLNSPPNTPTITGNTTGISSKFYEYGFSTVDPDNDCIEYMVDWGDGTQTSWLGPFNSGQKATASHQWNESGTYFVRVKAKDSYGYETEWSSSLAVRIVTLNQVSIFGLIYEKKLSGEFMTFNAKLLVVLPSSSRLYYSGETIIISSRFTSGFVGKNVAFGRFDAAFLQDSLS